MQIVFIFLFIVSSFFNSTNSSHSIQLHLYPSTAMLLVVSILETTTLSSVRLTGAGCGRLDSDVLKKLAGQDEKPSGLDQVRPGLFCCRIRKKGIVETSVSCFLLATVDVVCQVFRNIAIKQDPKDILLEVPAVHAAPQIIGNIPYGAVQLRPLLLFSVVSHGNSSLPVPLSN